VSAPINKSSGQSRIACRPSPAMTIERCYTYNCVYQTLVQHGRPYCRNHSHVPPSRLESGQLHEKSRAA
jgi:hypothetical protein